MPGTSTNKDILEEPESSEIEQRPDPANKSLEFRAEVIPYEDPCTDPCSPILAFSGDNINLIFTIPKQRFLKLAVAAVSHLGHDSDFKPPEKQCGNSTHKEISNSRLSDVVKDLDGDNTNEIVKSYEEDSNESQNSGNKDNVLSVDFKSCKDNGSIKLRSEYISNDRETSKLYRNTETNSFEESSNFQSAVADSDKSLPTDEKYSEQKSSEVMYSINESVQIERNDLENYSEVEVCQNEDSKNTEEKLEGNKSGSAGHSVEQEYNSEDRESEVEIAGEINLSAHSLGISWEDCPELENVWPDIHSYEKTEEIPVIELKSLESEGVLTKYLKLELLKEFILIRVTSDSNVLVDAVKYKELGAECISKAASYKDISENEPTQSLISDVCTESLPVSNNAASVEISKADKSSNSESKYVNAEEAKSASVLVDKNLGVESESLEPKNNAKSASEEPLAMETQPLSGNFSKTTGAGTSETYSEDVTDGLPSNDSSNVADNSSDKMFDFGTSPESEKMISQKIDRKLKSFDKSIPGDSPTERLKRALNDSLKNPYREMETNKIEKAASTENLLNESDKVISLNADEKISDTNSELISLGHFSGALECSDSCDSNTAMNLGHKNKSESLDALPNDKLTKPVSDHAYSKKKPIRTSLDNCKSELAGGDVSAIKLISNDSIFEGANSIDEVSLKETNIEKVSETLSSGDKESLEDSALGNDLHVSETETLNNFSQLKNMQCKEIDSHELNSILCKFKKGNNETLNDADATSFSKDTDDCSNESSEKDVILENGQKETVVEISKLKASECVLEECLAENSQTSTNNDFMEEPLKNKLHTDMNESVLEKYVEVKETDKRHENLQECTEPEYVKEISDLPKSLCTEKIPDDKCEAEVDQSNEMKDAQNEKAENLKESIAGAKVEAILNESTNSPKNATDEPSCELFVKQTSECLGLSENSFSSNMDSFMDSTVDTIVESASEGGDCESDDVKSITSESDDIKDSEKQTSKRKGGLKKNIREVDEVDCAPTRIRTKKPMSGLSKHVIPENSEVKNGKVSKARGSNLNVPGSFNTSGRISPIGRSLRSKSLDPTPQPSKGILHDKHVAESEEATRRTRAKTPDIVSKKDLKITARSSPRKLSKAATIEHGSASKVGSTKPVTDDRSKTRAKRGSKE